MKKGKGKKSSYKMNEIKIEDEFELDLSLYHSFVSALFKKSGEWWIKIFGHSRGAKIRIRDGKLVFDGADLSEVRFWTGLWFNPLTAQPEVRSKNISKIIELYKRLRIPISPWDKLLLLVVAFLSRRTDYHRNVLRWTSKIFELASNIRDISRLDVTRIGNSYQLKQLPTLADQYFSRIREEGDYWNLRKALLGLSWVGPKVADSYLLFSRGITELAPSDVHYARFVKRLRILNFSRLPEKRFCFYYTCPNCPIKSSCLTGLSHEKLGRLAGWFQSVAYVHGTLYCSLRFCLKCKFRDTCSF